MTAENSAWVLLADARHGRLLHCSRTPYGRCHVQEVAAIATEAPVHHRQSTSPIWKNPTTTFGIEKQDTSERVRRFARQIGLWLEQNTKAHRIQQIALLSSPPLLAALRHVRTARFPQRLLERRIQLASLPISELAEHPTIHRLVGIDQS